MAFGDALRPTDGATVVLNVDTSQTAKLERAEAQWRDSVGTMSREALKLDLAQERLRTSLQKYGAESSQAKRATIALKDAEESATRSADRHGREINQVERAQTRARHSTRRLTRSFGGLRGSLALLSASLLGGTGVIFAIRSTISASLAFESAFAGIRKTVDATEPEFAALSDEIRRMSREIPITVEELAKIGELGGQLGIGKEALTDFIRTIADLGQTTDLSVEQASTSLAQFAAITRLPQSQIDRLGASTVALGNNFATTESKIVDFGLRIAAAGKIVGFTDAQILATAAAFSSVGVEAEAGGTAVSKVFIAIANAVKSGNANLQNFAETAGMSVVEFQELFGRDSASAFLAFTEGLRRVDKEGGNVFKTLSDLGLTDQRLTRAFLSISQSQGTLRRAFELSSDAWRENNALTEEARKRYETNESRLKIFRNRVNDLQITIGDGLTPALLELLEPLNAWLDSSENQERVAKQVNRAVEAGEQAVRGLAAAFRIVESAVKPFVGALGGVENTVKLMTLAFVAFKVKAVAAFVATAAASTLASRKMVADAAVAGAAWDVATRPRIIPVGFSGPIAAVVALGVAGYLGVKSGRKEAINEGEFKKLLAEAAAGRMTMKDLNELRGALTTSQYNALRSLIASRGSTVTDAHDRTGTSDPTLQSPTPSPTPSASRPPTQPTPSPTTIVADDLERQAAEDERSAVRAEKAAERQRKAMERAIRAAEERAELFAQAELGRHGWNREGMRRAALRGLKTGDAAKKAADSARPIEPLDPVAFLSSLRGTMNQFGGNLFAPGSLQVAGSPNPELFSMVTELREQTSLLAGLTSSARHPGTRNARTEFALAFDGPTF